MFVDIHCHLDALEDPEQAVLRAKKAQVSLIITNGLNYENNTQAIALSSRFPSVKAALGLYPNDAAALLQEEREKVYEQIRSSNPIAIGEIGLDYYHDDTKQSEMKQAFHELLTLAEELKKPVIVHSRKAEQDVLSILSSYDVVADLHCFGGSLKLARQGIDAGHYFSIPTSVVRATHFQRLTQETPAEQLLSETDAPWMSPDDEPNEPAKVVVGVQAMALARKESLEGLREQLMLNARRFIGADKE